MSNDNNQPFWCVMMLSILLCSSSVLLLLSFFYLIRRSKITESDPGTAFEIRYIGELPFLWSYDLPYPGDVEESNRAIQRLNGCWKMRFDPQEIGEGEGWQQLLSADENWQDVRIPSSFNSLNSPFREYEGVTWFLLRFHSDLLNTPDEFLRLCFRGVLLRSKIWLNGTLLGDREGGYTPFFFNVSDFMLPDNVLIVKCDNRLTWNSLPPKTRKGHNPAWWPYGGIYRDVYIEKISNHYSFKIHTSQESHDTESVLHLSVLTHNMGKRSRPYIFSCELFDDGQNSVAKAELQREESEEISRHDFSMRIPEPRRWSTLSPSLYTLNVLLHGEDDLPSDRVSIKIGFRDVRLEKTRLLINGKPQFLRGISKMEDHQELGATQTKESIARDLALVKKLYANFIRLAHYPHCAEELRQARDSGIMLGGEIALYHAGIGWVHWFLEDKRPWTFPFAQFGVRQMNEETLLQNAQRELIEMIERDRNNPAIIMWFIANESYSFSPKSGEAYKRLKETARQFDDSRPVTCTELIYSLRWVDRFRHSSRFMDILALNAYHGWYYSNVEAIAPHVRSYHHRYPNKPIIISEFGAEAAYGRCDEDGEWRAERVPQRRTYSESYQAEVISGFVENLAQQEEVAGLVPWVFADFASHWFPSNPVPYHNCKGLLTSDRRPKQAYFALQERYRELQEDEEQDP